MKKITSSLLMVNFAITFLLLFFCHTGAKAQRTFKVNGRVIHVKKLNKQIETIMDSTSSPGLSFAVIDQNKIVFYNTYGYKRIKRLANGKIKGEGKVNKRTLFEACSMSKNFFLFAVERLLDQGLFNLDTPLYHYLEYPRLAYDERYKKITGRMVLSHSSGIENWQNYNDAGKLEILADPGTNFIYSGEGYLYMSKVVEKLLGKSVETYMDELVIKPLKLKRTYTTMVKDGHMRRNYCMGHNQFLDGSSYKTKNDTPNIATWNVTTAYDYAKLLIDFFNAKYLSQIRVGDIIGADPTIHYPAMDKNTHWGPGFAVSYEGGDTILFQGGDNVVFKGFGYYSIKQKSGYVMLSNGENGIGILKMLDSFTTARYSIFNLDEQYPNTWFKILNVYNKQGYPAALNYFKTLAAKKDSSILLSDFKYWAVDGSYLHKEPEFAANIALEYQSRYPSSKEAVVLHGKAMMKMKKYDAAIADFKKAMQLDNGSQSEMESLIKECSAKVNKGN